MAPHTAPESCSCFLNYEPAQNELLLSTNLIHAFIATAKANPLSITASQKPNVELFLAPKRHFGDAVKTTKLESDAFGYWLPLLKDAAAKALGEKVEHMLEEESLWWNVEQKGSKYHNIHLHLRISLQAAPNSVPKILLSPAALGNNTKVTLLKLITAPDTYAGLPWGKAIIPKNQEHLVSEFEAAVRFLENRGQLSPDPQVQEQLQHPVHWLGQRHPPGQEHLQGQEYLQNQEHFQDEGNLPSLSKGALVYPGHAWLDSQGGQAWNGVNGGCQ